MDANSQRWHRVTPSTFPWEDEAIDFLRNGINDADPNRGWSNFEFVSGGVISEVDVLLLTRKGAFLIEIKSTPGRLTGDQQQWVFTKPGGGRSAMENPLLGANRKAKRLKSLLEYRWAKAAGAKGPARPPFIQPVVFLSDPNLEVDLTADARAHVYGRDGSIVTKSGALPGIFEGVRQIGGAEANNPRFRQLDTYTAVAVSKALEAIGIKESDHTRRVGSWLLRLDTVTERPGIQDFVADHERSTGVQRRVRIYSKQPQMSEEQATSLRLAADREFLVADRVTHPNVVPAFERFDTDLGAAVVFEYEPTAVRLDQWITTTEGLEIYDRLLVLRQLAETMRVVHRRKVTHRSLSPGSVLVRPGRTGEPRWVVLVTDFSLAGREHARSTSSYLGTRTATRAGTGFGLPSAAPGDVELLADESALLFCAPEIATEDDPDGVSLDVFSFGAIAYEVLSGRPPGDSRESVRDALRAGRGLQLAAVAPGSVDALCRLVLEATRPLVSERMTSFDDVLVELDQAEDQLTAPTNESEEPEDVDPLDSRVGTMLGDGTLVKRRLGRGSTALALLVDRGEGASPREVVYKVSLGGDSDVRLAAEAKALSGLRHPAVVEVFGTTELSGRPVLIEAMAGTQSLADELRSNGTPSIEFLERWGTDLLDALRYLEREGRWHRDIKPDNLGVTEIGPNREQHLVLFDFSLAEIPSTDLRAGTPPYLEPFLADRTSKQWDLNAERYAAAITLYEMATGEVPRWGDGRSNPAFTTGEVTLDALLFDPAARDPLEAFFARALKRNSAARFGNAEDMLRAWQRVFEGLDAAVLTTVPSGDASVESEAADTRVVELPTALAVGDPIISLGTNAKVISALNRLGVSTVRQLADLAPIEVNRARRISPRIRRRIIELRAAVLVRFADELATEPVPTAATGESTGGDDLFEGQSAEEAPRLDLDRLVPLLVPTSSRPRGNDTEQRAVRMLLGLEPVADTETSDWASQNAVADAVGVTRGRVGQIGPKARAYWSALGSLDSVRDEIVETVAANGGVMAIREIEHLVTDARGSGLAEADAARAARAVVRAAIEAEETGGSGSGPASSRLVVRRRGDRVIVAVDIESADQDAVGEQITLAGFDVTFDGQALGAYAASLGTKADEMVASQADVIPQDRAVQPLRSVTAPAGVMLSDGRLLRLAASCSQRVGVSSALELYPVDLDPVRALRLTRQSLAAADDLTVDEVRFRVQARFPQTQLPSRPELDRILAEADVIVTWAGDRDRFVRHGTVVGELSTMTSAVSYHPTRFASPTPGGSTTAEVDVDVVRAQEVEDRLERSLAQGGFLALRVATSQGPAVRRGLQRFTAAPFDMIAVDLERWFLDELLASARAVNVAWEKVLQADLATDGTDFANLRRLTHEAAGRLEERVLHAGPRVLAWNPGILAAYDEINVIDRLRMQAGRATSTLQTMWLVVFGATGEARPMVDGRPIPVEGPGEWVDLPTPWLKNLHRERLAASTSTSAKGTS